MNVKIIILAVLAIAVASYLMITSQHKVEEKQSLFPELTLEKLNDITQIDVYSENKEFKMVRDEQKIWRLPESQNYPANAIRIRRLLNLLAEAKKIEPKTAVVENYSRLGVQDPTAEGAINTLITLTSPDKKRSLIMGRPDPKLSKGQYVRRPDEKQSWLINQRILFEVDGSEWLDKEILHIESRLIESIEVTDQASGMTLLLAREGPDKPMKLKTDLGLKKDKVKLEDFAVRRLDNLLDYMRFKNLLSDADELPKESKASGKYKTYTGLEITVTAYEGKEKKQLFTLMVKARENADAVQQQRAAQIAGIVKDRIYEVPDSSYKSLVNGVDSLVKLLKTDEDKDEESEEAKKKSEQ